MSKIVKEFESNVVKSKENIEDIIKEIESFEPVVALRLGIVRFMENLSFDERYLKKVQMYKRNKKEIDFLNILKAIRNNKLIKIQ